MVRRCSRSREAEVEAVPQENAWNFEEEISRVTAISRLRSEDSTYSDEDDGYADDNGDDDDGNINVASRRIGNDSCVCMQTNRPLRKLLNEARQYISAFVYLYIFALCRYTSKGKTREESNAIKRLYVHIRLTDFRTDIVIAVDK